ncbi:MAG: Nif3-like dinuclear metal center hexameric protein [Acidimicrobiia bacterium]
MATVSEVLSRLDVAAPASSAASWDPAGLQLGNSAADVGSVGVCHEVTEEVVDAVEASRPDLLITYHPLLFRPTNRFVTGATPTGRAWRLARVGVSVAVTHTSFDAAPGGTSDSLADVLGLSDLRPFGPSGPAPSAKIVTFVPAEALEAVASGMTDAGGGRIGNYSGCSFRIAGTGAFEAGEGAAPTVGDAGTNRVDEVRLEMLASPATADAVIAAMVAAHPYEEPAYDVYETVSNGRFIGRVGRHSGSFDALVDQVGTSLGQVGLRVTKASDRADAVAVLPGSGASFLASARAAGADVIVTGDVDHHRALEARDQGMSIIDAGHAATERPGMVALVEAVRRACSEATLIDLTGYDPTPWR